MQLFMSLPTQAEESFLGAERPNENGRLTERCRRCRLKFFCIPEISDQAEEGFWGRRGQMRTGVFDGKGGAAV